MKKMISNLKSMALVLLISMFMITNYFHPVRVKAVDVQLPIAVVIDANMATMLASVKASISDWFLRYDYCIIKLPNNAGYNFIIMPKSVVTKLILADNQMDAPYQQDIDQFIAQMYPTVANPGYGYIFNASYVYQGRDVVTSTVLHGFSASAPIVYTNFPLYTYLSYVVPPYNYTTTMTTLNPINYGFKEIPVSLLPEFISPTTDEVQTRELIEANWGMFNFLKDGLNASFAWLVDTINLMKTLLNASLQTILSPLGGMLDTAFSPSQKFMDDLYPRYSQPITLKLGFLWYPFEWFGGLVTSITSSPVTGSFTFGQLFGAPLKLDMNDFKNGAPSVWSFMILMIRGVLSYELISGFYHKVTSKMKGTS